MKQDIRIHSPLMHGRVADPPGARKLKVDGGGREKEPAFARPTCNAGVSLGTHSTMQRLSTTFVVHHSILLLHLFLEERSSLCQDQNSSDGTWKHESPTCALQRAQSETSANDIRVNPGRTPDLISLESLQAASTSIASSRSSQRDATRVVRTELGGVDLCPLALML